MSNRITISEVAHEAGVSMMTVSRVINRKGEVSAATIQRVQRVIERLGYRPSSIARGGTLAAQHLIASGHRAIGFLAGPLASFSGRERSRGFQAALAKANISFHPDWAQPGLPTLEGGKQAAQQLLHNHPELTALYCYNDLVAVGALHACRALERRVPEDIAIVGSDDIPLASLVMPQLTTCRVPLLEMGARAMQLVLKRIQGDTDDSSNISLEPVLDGRASAPELFLR